ncbi:MAG: hypothetical protein HFF17_06655 [Oscillospiraceae bacterium]|nr:hypothetical protein [Oscillospiraceae bacterium]
MAKIGALGEVVFEASEEKIETVHNVRWSGSARYATHNRVGTNALTEFLGVAPDKMRFDMVLSVNLGVDPMQELVKLWDYKRSGRAVSMILGTKAYGKYRWNVLSIEVKLEAFDVNGDLAHATVSVTLQEYLRE